MAIDWLSKNLSFEFLVTAALKVAFLPFAQSAGMSHLEPI
jgi:hypothetical protein